MNDSMTDWILWAT